MAWQCISLTQYRGNHPRTLCAASRMTLVTAFGCEIIERCPPLTRVILAWARVAMNCSTFGGMARSIVPRTYQLGIVFQATAPHFAVRALNVAGACLAS